MKNHSLKSALIGLLLIVAPFVWAADEEYRIFKSTDGREISASILGCDTDAGKVLLKIEGRKRGWVPFSALSPEDQAYVRKWYGPRACFLSDGLFNIKLTEEDGEWKQHMGVQEERFTRYVLKLNNRGDLDLDDIEIVCCEIREKNGGTSYSHYNLSTTMVAAGDRVEEEKEVRSSRNEKRHTHNSVVGTRMRLYWTPDDGRELMREVFMPKNLSDERYPWKDPVGRREKLVVDLTPKEWKTLFFSQDLFSVKLTEEDYGWEKYMGIAEARYTRLVIELSNRGSADLDTIRIVCCEIREENGAATYSHSDLETTQVRAGEKEEEGKVLFSRRNRKRNTINTVIGVRVRLYWTSPDGSEFMREVYSPKGLSNEKYPWKDPKKELEKQEDQVAGRAKSLPIAASISNVSTEETKHTTKKRGTYQAQTFEYTYSIGPCKSYRIKSYFEFKDHRDKVTFMSSQSNHSSGSSKPATVRSVLNIDAREHGLKNIKLNAYWIEIYAIDESGDSHLVAEAHDGCTSLEQLKERNDPPIGV